MTDPDDDAWTALDEVLALHTASDVAEFQRRLVLYPGSFSKRSDAFEPWCLFRQFHKDNPEDALTTALLLVTDRRWRNATGRLIRQIDESGLISHNDLDILAQTFLAAGPQVYWEVPGEWFDGPAIAIDLGPHPVDDDPDDDGGQAPDTSDGGPVVVGREVRPPLRRWAAGRILRADSAMWGPLIKRAREIDPRSGAAIVRGVLDGIDTLTPAARGAVVKLATTWPQQDVREAATELASSQATDNASPLPQTPRRDWDLRSGDRKASHPGASQPSLF